MLEHTEFSFGKNKNLWRCYCTVHDIIKNGKPWRPACYGKTKKEAREKLEAKLLEQDMGIIEAKMNCSLENAISRYADKAQLKKVVTDSTISYWRRILRNQIAPYDIAKMNVNKVNHEHVIDFILELKEDGVSQAMQKKTYNILTMFYKDYYERTPFRNPAYGLKFSTKKVKVEASQILNDEEIKIYFDTCESCKLEYIGKGVKNPDFEKNYDLLEFLLITYMRKGEALALTFRDFTENDNVLNIKKTVTRTSKERKIREGTKTESSDRELILNDIAYGILNARLMDAQIKEDFSYDWLVFPGEESPYKPLSDHGLRRLNDRMIERSKISKHIRVHDLRHTGISYYLRHGSSLADVSKRAGHSKQSITADIYSHVLDETLKKQAEKESDIAVDLMKLN